MSLYKRILYLSLYGLTARFKDFDALCFCEVCPNSNFKDEMIKIDNFEIF